MNILVVVAHPDDEVYGMGGTIAKLAYEGHDIYILVVTDGCTSQYRGNKELLEIIETKKYECEKANLVLGVKKVIYGNLPDMRLDTLAHVDINSIIEKNVQNIKPECVYTHFYGDINLDHQRVYQSVLVAARPTNNSSIKSLYSFYIPSSTEWAPQLSTNIFLPNTYVDIENYRCKKIEAIKIYQTELRDFPHPRSVEAVDAYDKAAGIRVGVKCAENFMLLRRIDK